LLLGHWPLIPKFPYAGPKEENFMPIKLSNSHYYFELNYDLCRSVKSTKIPFFIP
jgi:hypothetical protein